MVGEFKYVLTNVQSLRMTGKIIKTKKKYSRFWNHFHVIEFNNTVLLDLLTGFLSVYNYHFKPQHDFCSSESSLNHSKCNHIKQNGKICLSCHSNHQSISHDPLITPQRWPTHTHTLPDQPVVNQITTSMTAKTSHLFHPHHHNNRRCFIYVCFLPYWIV